MLKKKLISLAKHDIAYSEHISSDESLPTIIFIHGNSSRKDIFNKTSESRYLQKYSFYILDLPGHGEISWAADAKYDVTYYAETIKEFLNALKIERPIVVGHSLGGHISVKLSAIIETQGLVIFQAPPIEYVKDLPLAFNLIPEFNCLYVEAPQEKDLGSLINLLSSDKSVQDEITTSFKRCDPKIRSRLAESLSGPEDYIGEVTQLKKYERPFLIIHSEDDPLVNLSYIRQFSFQIALIKEGGHYPTLSNPSGFLAHLESFLKNGGY